MKITTWVGVAVFLVGILNRECSVYDIYGDDWCRGNTCIRDCSEVEVR